MRKGDFDRPVLAFESGALLTVNQTNTRTLVRAYGKDPSKYTWHSAGPLTDQTRTSLGVSSESASPSRAAVNRFR